MSKFDFARPGGQWPNETVVGAEDYAAWDLAQSKAINGDDGGTWNPAAPITFGASTLMTLATATSVLNGGVATKLGGRALFGSVGSTDFPVLSPARSRSTVFHLFESSQAVSSQLPDSSTTLITSPALGVQLPTTIAQIPVPKRYLHHGGRIVSAKLTFRLLARPTALPTHTMWFQFGGLTPSLSFQTGPTMAAWVTATPYSVGSYVVPTEAKQTGFYYKVAAISGTGTSGGTEPTWPTLLGQTVTDNPGANQIIWTCENLSGQFPNKTLTVDGYWNGGQPQSLTFGFDGIPTIDAATYKYFALFFNNDPNLIHHSIQFTFDNITRYAFE